MFQGSGKNKAVRLKRVERLTRYTHTNITVTLRFEDENDHEGAIWT